MQELLDRIEERDTADSVGDSLSEDLGEEELTTDVLKQRLNEQLGAMSEGAKRAVAAHLTPEFAKLVGIITGSQQLADVLDEMANPSIALVPMPREKAQELLAQVQGGTQPQPQPEPQGQAMPAPAGPSGAMGM